MTNTNAVDRTLRIIAGVILISLLYVVGPTLAAWIAAAVGLVLLVTAITGFCPIYRILGWRTNASH